jgi:predicted RNase H-like nuclease
MVALGVDGRLHGWIAVWIDEAGRKGFKSISAIDEILQFDATVTLIDIPIGLPEAGYRACDLAARSVLGEARSRVFLGVRRPLLERSCIIDFQAANACGKRIDGKGISIQTHAILSKVAEVDALMTPKGQEGIRETHPELTFKTLNGDKHLDNKQSSEGRKQRRAILLKNGFDAIDSWLVELRGTGAKADDLFDACAAAIAAVKPIKLECAEEVDARGLRMEMWY